MESAADDFSVSIVAYLAKRHIWLSEGSIGTELESAENEASVSCMQHLCNREARRALVSRICDAIRVKQSVLSELIFFFAQYKLCSWICSEETWTTNQAVQDFSL